MTEADLAIVRRAYAKHVMMLGGVHNPVLEHAFESVRREDFLGAGPWQVWRWSAGYDSTPSDDPVYLYCNALFAIVAERGLNNGEPSSHAMWIASVSPLVHEHVVHIGAGVGYYSAIFATMAGRVTAIEYEAELAERATANLAPFSNVDVVAGDGARYAFAPADVIYVNAGASRPLDHWLDSLREGGRLLVPLTAPSNFTNPMSGQISGGYFRITRRAQAFEARWISPVAVFPCVGARDPESDAALAEAFKVRRWNEVTRLYRTDDLPEEQCWLRAPGWSLAYH